MNVLPTSPDDIAQTSGLRIAITPVITIAAPAATPRATLAATPKDTLDHSIAAPVCPMAKAKARVVNKHSINACRTK